MRCNRKLAQSEEYISNDISHLVLIFSGKDPMTKPLAIANLGGFVLVALLGLMDERHNGHVTQLPLYRLDLGESNKPGKPATWYCFFQLFGK